VCVALLELHTFSAFGTFATNIRLLAAPVHMMPAELQRTNNFLLMQHIAATAMASFRRDSTWSMRHPVSFCNVSAPQPDAWRGDIRYIGAVARGALFEPGSTRSTRPGT
jgi:hypothetical protein